MVAKRKFFENQICESNREKAEVESFFLGAVGREGKRWEKKEVSEDEMKREGLQADEGGAGPDRSGPIRIGLDRLRMCCSFF